MRKQGQARAPPACLLTDDTPLQKSCQHADTHTYTHSLSHCILSRSHQLKADGDRQAFHSSFFQLLYDGRKHLGHRGFNTQAPGPMSPAQPGLFCEPVIVIELSLVVGAKEDYARRLGVRRWLVADQADELWESPMAFLLG